MSYEVTFEAGPPRAYTVAGKAVPSVTHVLGTLDKSGPLVWWAWKVGLEDVCALAAEQDLPPSAADLEALLKEMKLTPNHRRDTAATRGHSVHSALEHYAIRGTPPKLSDYPEADRGYVQGLAKWLVECSPTFEASEVMVGSKEHGYAGRYDLRARVDGRLLLIDAKTSAKGRVYDTAHLQLAGYEAASIEMGADPTDGRYVLAVAEDGTYSFKETCGTPEQFLAVLGAYRAMEELKGARKALGKAQRDAATAERRAVKKAEKDRTKAEKVPA